MHCINNEIVDGVEIDIRLTKDNKIVIIHDSLINFCSNGSGIVKFMTYKKLLKYNFGSKEHPEKICLLEDFLKRINNNKIILIEIKSRDLKINNFLNKILKKFDLNYYICSFSYDIIFDFKKKYNYNTGLIIGMGQNISKLYNHFNFNIVSYYYKNNVSRKKETFLWTMNLYKEDLNNFFIVTDYPSRFYLSQVDAKD